MYKEKDIKHENGKYWVLDTGKAYEVVCPVKYSTVSATESAYAHNADGLSIAIYRCDYLAKRGLTVKMP